MKRHWINIVFVTVCLVICSYFVLFPTVAAFGQNRRVLYNVSGFLTDSLGMPVPDANIIFGAKGEKKTYYASSDVKGCFSVKLPDGGYSMGITHLSYKDLVDEIIISSDTTLAYKLSTSSNSLSAVSVYGDYISYKGARYTVKVRGNPLAEDRSVLSFMNELPGIRGISVNGVSATIYINGREMKMSNDELLKYLSSIPTESIEEISVRATKSASTRSSGNGATIIIRTRKTDKTFYSGLFGLTSTHYLENGAFSEELGGSFGYFDKKVSSLTYLNMNGRSRFKGGLNENIFEGKREYYKSESGKNSYMTFDQSLFYDFDENHSVGVGMNIFYKPDRTNTTQYYGFDAMTPFVKDVTSNMDSEDFALNYKYSFGKKKSELNIKADLLSDSQERIERYSDMADAQKTGHKDRYLNYGLNADLTLRGFEGIEWNVGADYISANGNRKHRYLTDGNHKKFKFAENILGLYTEVSGTLIKDKLRFNAGLRYENYFNRKTDLYGTADTDKLHDNDILPNIDLTYNSTKAGYTLIASYRKSVHRPTLFESSPFVSRDGSFISREDGLIPVLPRYRSTVSLTQYYKNVHSLSLSYSKCRNVIAETYMEKDGNLIVTTAPTGSETDYMAEYSSNFWVVKDKLRANLTASGIYMYMNRGEVADHNWWAVGRVSFTYYPQKDWRVLISGRYYTPMHTTTTKMSADWIFDVSVSKKMNKHWQLSIYTEGLLYKKNVKIESTVKDIDYVNRKRMKAASVVIALRYRFGYYDGKRILNIGAISERGGKKN